MKRVNVPTLLLILMLPCQGLAEIKIASSYVAEDGVSSGSSLWVSDMFTVAVGAEDSRTCRYGAACDLAEKLRDVDLSGKQQMPSDSPANVLECFDYRQPVFDLFQFGRTGLPLSGFRKQLNRKIRLMLRPPDMSEIVLDRPCVMIARAW